MKCWLLASFAEDQSGETSMFPPLKKCLLSLVPMIVTALTCAGLGIHGATNLLERSNGKLDAPSEDPSELSSLRWDLAKAFAFDWEAIELSSKVAQGADTSAPVRTVIVSVRLTVLDFKRLVILDTNSPGILEVLDQNGNPVECQAVGSNQTRRYDNRRWYWDETGTYLAGAPEHFNLAARLSSDSKQSLASSISQLEGYVYAIYADEVIRVDIPFDPNYGWHQTQAVPDLMLRVDPTTAPCPGPLQYTRISALDSQYGLWRPTTPVPLYKYQTRAKSKAGGPMMGLYDPGLLYPRGLYSLGDYAIVRTELLDSKNGKADHFFTQWILGDPSGGSGASCNGQMEQSSVGTYDSIRHVIAVHPIEVKIPFVLKNIPMPKLLSAAK